MKQPEIKEALIGALRTGMDSLLELRGFNRSAKGLVYSRAEDGTRCQFAMEFASNPGYAHGILAHLTPALRIANHRISDLALRLVEDPFLLANAPEVILNLPLTLVAKPRMPEWHVANVGQLENALEEIRGVFFEHGIPFLDDYSTPEGIITQHEAGDTRALRQQHYYIFVIAAYLLEGMKESAQAVLDEKFSKPGIKRRFESLWRNVNADHTLEWGISSAPPLKHPPPVRGSEG